MAKKAKSRRPGLLRTLLAVLVVLALAATLLFTVFRRQVDTMEYPCRYNEYVEYYAGKYNIDPLIYTPSFVPRATLIQTLNPTFAPAA